MSVPKPSTERAESIRQYIRKIQKNKSYFYEALLMFLLLVMMVLALVWL